jgi:DNA polymerase-1
MYAQYAAQKAFAISQLKKDLLKEIKEHNQEQLLFDIEIPLASVLAKMEIDGIEVDRQKLKTHGEEISKKIKVLSEKIIELAGYDFTFC